MGFVLPAGVANTNTVYYYAVATSVAFGPLVKEPNDQTLVMIDYSTIAGFTLSNYNFGVDVSSNPQLVVSFPSVNASGTELRFLLSGGIPGQQYTLTISASSGATLRVDKLTISVPSSGDCDCETINPVPALLSELPLGGSGYANTAIRLFWGSVPPANPNALDQWYDTTNLTTYEWITDGTTYFWSLIASPETVPVPEAPNDGQLYGRKNSTWVPIDISSIPSTVTISLTPPVSPIVGSLWFDSSSAQVYVWYDDGNSRQWVPIVNQVGAGGGGGGPTNPPPTNTSPPTITGTIATGQDVTCLPGTWTGSPTYAYLWQRNGVSIGVTTATYHLAITDDSQSITCLVTATNANGSTPAMTAPIIPTTPPAPAIITLPLVTVVGGGTAVIGVTLNCTNGSWTGSPTGYTYQWMSGVTPIGGQTTANYVVASGDALASISCVVTATNSAGNGTAASNAVSIPPLVPANTVLPTLSGTFQVGNTLSCLQGTWINSPTGYAYQWLRNGITAVGTGPSYALVTADGGNTISCVVTASNAGGSASASTVSQSILPAAPVNTGAPSISGSTIIPGTLTCNPGTWTGSPTYAYQWRRGGTPIAGATSSGYTTSGPDYGFNVDCAVTGSNAGGGVTVNSNALGITVAAPVNSLGPSITGSTSVGSTLTCNPGTWTGSPTYTYQWMRNSVNIPGEIASTHIVATADQGYSVNCNVTATNAGGSASLIAPSIAIPYYFPAGAAAIYSTRLAGAGYAGKCVNVRRSNDNATQDIGFASSGLLDWAAAQTFAGANNLLFVAKWYDQSGNGLNLLQATAILQPQLIAVNGVAYLTFGSGQTLEAATVGGAALTGDQTIGLVAQVNGSNQAVPFACADGTNAWALFTNATFGTGTTGKLMYYSQGGTLADTASLFSHMPVRLVATRASGVGKVYNNGVQTATASGLSNTASTTPLQIGALNGGAGFEGMIAEAFIYPSALGSANLSAIDANEAAVFPNTGFMTPYSGTACVQFGQSDTITLGNVLNYERTQTFTAFAAVQLYDAPAAFMCVFTNVPASGTAYPGYEMFIDVNGKLRVRIMHDIGAGNYIGLIGTKNVCDGAKHMVAYSYDGSSAAAGVKLYIDGVLETTTIEHDALSATIIGSGQSMYIGMQQGVIGYNLRGTLSLFQIDNVVRSGSYILAHSVPSSLPPIDANTDLCLLLNEGTGTTTADASGHGHNGTLHNAFMWVPAA